MNLSMVPYTVHQMNVFYRLSKIQEIDVNPLLVVDGEPVAVDATIVLRK